jgi:membrane-associated phospholipid phosphatase
MIAGIAVLVALLAQRRTRELAFVVLAVGGMLVLDPVLKELFQRPPITEGSGGYSFPSGTAMISLAAFGATVLLIGSRRARTAAIAIAGPIALGLEHAMARSARAFTELRSAATPS